MRIWKNRFRRAAMRVVPIIAAGTLCAVVAGAQSLAPGGTIIRSGCEVDYSPFCIVDADGRADGFSVELLRAALAKMDRDVTFRTGLWSDVLGWLERGEVDALPLVGRTPEREDVFDFTVPYLTLHGALVVRKDTTDVKTLADLSGRRVAAMKDDNSEEFLRRNDRGFEIITTPTFTDALHALAEGRCDAVAIQRLVAIRLLDETGMDNLMIIDRPIHDFAQEFCFAVKYGDRETLAILNEGLALAIADGTHRRLYAKWFAALELPSDRPIVIGGDRNYPPFEFLDETGQPAGYNVDIVRAIAEATGLDIRIRLGDWPAIKNALERGEIDAIQGMLYSQERDETFDFSQAHLVNHCVAVVRKEDGPSPSALADLSGKRIVVQDGDILHEYCRQNGLTNRLTIVDSQEQALGELAAGKHDCALVARMAAYYWIEREGWDRLAVGRTPLVSPDYGFAVLHGQRALLAQLSEGLTAIAHSGEYKRIQEKWMGVYQEPTNLRNVLKVLAWVAGPLLIIALLALLWSWGLRKQVARRTAELQEKEMFIRTVLDNLPVGVAVNSLEPAMAHYMNDLFPKIYRTTRDKIASPDQFWQTVYPDPEFRRKIQAQVEADCRSGDPERMVWTDIPLERPGEPTTYITARNTLIPGSQLMISSVWDVTERKQTERTILESEARLSLATQAAGIGIWDRDIVNNVLSWDDRMFEIYGVKPDAFGGAFEAWQQGVHPEDLAMAIAEVAAAERGEKPFDTEFRIVRPNGDVRHIKAHAQVLRDEAGIAVRMIGVNYDITERKRLEAQLLQAQKMESVGRLAGGVAHDFNNLLMGIMGYAELCREDLPENHHVREWLDEITREAQRSANLTRQLLAFARKQTVAPKVLDLNDAVANMLKMLRRLIGEDIDLTWQPGAELGSVKIDPSQVDQILANLCVNARDAIGGAGKITIETNNVSIDADYCADHVEAAVGSYVILAVSDDGCGMDRETLSNVFEPFFTTKPAGEGTGLGLATIYGIVKQNNGFVNVYSEPGKGSTFRIYLPCDTSVSNAAPEAATKTGSQGGTETILLVEDETAIRTIMCLFLEKLGYNVIPAESPAEALRLAKAHRDGIDLMITDVVMPGMSGRDLAEKLAPDYPSMKILYMSGYTANVIAHRGILDEGVHFLGKPVGRDALAQKVREVLG